jgi:hypothetical protein
LIFAPNKIQEVLVPDIDAKVKQVRPMDKLQRRMWVYWNKRKKNITPSFSLWLESQLEEYGQQFLDQLN